MKSSTDGSALWQSFKEGDSGAFRSLYRLYFDPLYEYGMRLLNEEHFVKDAIHDLFVKIWNNKNNLAAVTAVKPYLMVSLRSILFNSLDKRKKLKLTDDVSAAEFTMSFSLENELINKENEAEKTALLIKALNQLTPRQKEALYLRYFENLSYEEIADILHITQKASYKLMARAIDALRLILNPLPISVLVMLLERKDFVFLLS